MRGRSRYGVLAVYPISEKDISRLNLWVKCSEILSGIRIQLSANHARHWLPGEDLFGATALTSEDLVYKARSGHIVYN